MAKLTTRLAFRMLLNEEKYLLRFLQAGYTREDRARLKHRFTKDELTLDKIEEVLERCGFSVAQEKQWNTPL